MAGVFILNSPLCLEMSKLYVLIFILLIVSFRLLCSLVRQEWLVFGCL